MWDVFLGFEDLAQYYLTPDSLMPYLGAAIQHRVTQELVVWGIIYFFVRKDIKKSLKASKEEFALGFNVVVDTIQSELKAVTKSVMLLGVTMEKVEEDHLKRFTDLTKKVDEQDGKNREFEKFPVVLKELVEGMAERIKKIETKLDLNQ